MTKLFGNLKPDTAINQELSQKYKLPLVIVAYIRAAMLPPNGRYNKESLITHIVEENENRLKYIAENQDKTNPQITDNIKGVKAKLDFRKGVIVILDNMPEDILKDILREEK